jgi:hypothetical protein
MLYTLRAVQFRRAPTTSPSQPSRVAYQLGLQAAAAWADPPPRPAPVAPQSPFRRAVQKAALTALFSITSTGNR